MKKKLIMKAHDAAKKNMGSFQKEYGKEEGKNIAYATMMKMAKAKKLAEGGDVASGAEHQKAFDTSDRRALEEQKKRDEEQRKRDAELVKGKKKMSPKYYADGGEVIGGSLKETKMKRRNPYDGNEMEADSLASELESENFAEGGMPGKKGAIMAIVAKLSKKPSEIGDAMSSEGEGGEEMGGEEEMSASHEAKMAAADEVMSALKSGDKMAFAGALENFISCCGDME